MAAKLAAYAGDFQPVLQALAEQKHEPIKPGYHAKEHFTLAELDKKHPKDLLYFTVPKSYRPDRPTGLIVFMHGGGKTTTREAPRATLNFPDRHDSSPSRRLGDLFDATGMIVVGPSAPWDPSTSRRWCVKEADEYLADVIQECKSRFNIDPDRVFLMGHSMGGFGAYHHIQRQPDRFAAVLVNSGSWSLGYWPVIRGTPLCIVHGVHDAQPGKCWHYTDIEYARWTDKILTQQKLDHVYLEHSGTHSISNGREKIAGYFKSARTLRRDPYARHIAVASPLGFKQYYCFPAMHNRWLSLIEATKGSLEYDELQSRGTESFETWHLVHRKVKHRGAAVEAVNRGDNTIAVSTKNVARFAVWLHPKMIDLAKPVKIVVDGKTAFDGRVHSSLATALESYERRGDWGLVYPIKIELVAGQSGSFRAAESSTIAEHHPKGSRGDDLK